MLYDTVAVGGIKSCELRVASWRIKRDLAIDAGLTTAWLRQTVPPFEVGRWGHLARWGDSWAGRGRIAG